MNLNLLASLLTLLSWTVFSSGFSPITLSSQKVVLRQLQQRTAARPTVTSSLKVRSKEEQDWMTEMESKSYDYIRENKEELFDHDDWEYYRSPDRKFNDMFDFVFPGVALFVLYFLFVAINL